MEFDRIYLEDFLEGLKKIPDKSIDLSVTDPPYEIETTGQVFISKQTSST